ncbi:2-oxoacid:acceptor oxidoreductase subunit alpha [Evansella cellulosilytica]|uniref:Pyruvate flavodoxin/ferredoxin oxidoreductase domain protein n=1 Tax=Evansella cellulosilytica (strain ATCC 21833 / DSM 2522 / FERM P-1141 / JCM 9156 / N-4) TaxID=649639 RepID=E6TS28_EVAC2|nr:2-oxoacid:acceptor oxidoreductase subunit alpha [Evansella cellulosilytica]ADU30682.1 pyruvate flavodoxin/ferredoxin oxidoreductase domain protein [Evansella cellulosilytica DSM 2522]
MINQLSWKVGGQQGEGIESTGEIFSMALSRLGYYLYGYRHFSSRIKGGHTNNKIRVSTQPMNSISDDLDILVAFDQETIDLNHHELRPGAIIIGDSKFSPVLPDGCKAYLFSIPFTEIATELGTSLMKNMVAVGASSALLGVKADDFQSVVEQIFSRKGASVVEKNMEAIKKGMEYFHNEAQDKIGDYELERADGKNRLFMIGNDAIAMGALAGGARFMPAYPITPASEIMEYLIKKLPEFGGTVIQTEDEIAACTMAIGANYAGVRSLTASAGPGLSLMMEAIGLSGITETPLVIVDTQRGGPSTGLPTKQEQSDIFAMIYGTHGEIPKVVIAPSTVEEAFYDAIEAFNIAEEYQVPVIIVTDLALSLGKQTVEPLDFNRIEIRRGKLNLTEELPELEKGQYFKRYEVTEDGISSRVVPGVKHGLHHVTGVEHNEQGKPSESPINRKAQMDKRMKKLDKLTEVFPNPIFKDERHEEADLLILGVNSTRGTIQEVIPRLETEGIKVNHGHIRLLHPFPTEELRGMVNKAKKVVVVENNATGQVAQLVKMNLCYQNVQSILKYDGNPFLPSEIYNECKELL